MKEKTINNAELNIFLLPGNAGFLITAVSKTNDGTKREELFCPGIEFEFVLTDHRDYGYLGDFPAITDYLLSLADQEYKDWMRGIDLRFDSPADITWALGNGENGRDTIAIYLRDRDIRFCLEVPAIFRSYAFTHDRLMAYNEARSKFVKEKVEKEFWP